MTFAKVGPTLARGTHLVSPRGEEARGGAFEAALGDSAGQSPDGAQASKAGKTGAGAASPLPTLSDIVALASRAAVQGTVTASLAKPDAAPAAPLAPQAGPLAVAASVAADPGALQADPFPVDAAGARKRGAPSDDANTPAPQPDATLLVAFAGLAPVPSPAVSVPPAVPSVTTPDGSVGRPSPSAPAAPATPVETPVAQGQPTLPNDAAATVRLGMSTVAGIVSEPKAAPATGERMSLDSVIEPASVQLSTHLGFSRGLAPARATTEAPLGQIAGRQAAAGQVSVGDLPADGHAVLASGSSAGAGSDSGADAHGSSSDRAAETVATSGAADMAAAVTPDAVATPQVSPLIRRVADSVATLVSTSVSVPSETTPHQVAPARTMDLQLAPAGLGTLSVRLHVSGRSLDLRLEASDAGTAAVIDRDRSSLVDALSGRDLHLQSLSVTTQDATTPSTTMQGARHEGGKEAGFADGGRSGSSGQGANGRSPADRDETPRQARRGAAARVEPGDSGLFV